eukprot:m.135114 g.135114  ORF g.135114 m.135114 type:complete len:108 (-) comp13972_c1_seq3:4765-5088(-)
MQQTLCFLVNTTTTHRRIVQWHVHAPARELIVLPLSTIIMCMHVSFLLQLHTLSTLQGLVAWDVWCVTFVVFVLVFIVEPDTISSRAQDNNNHTKHFNQNSASSSSN